MITIAASWWLALVAIWVLQQAHSGLSEHKELPALLHLVRDAALAVPIAAVAVVASALILAPRLDRVHPTGRRSPTDFDRLLWVLLASGIFAILAIPGSQVHGVMFGAQAEAMGWLTHALLESVIAFIGALIALFPLALVVGPPVRRPQGALIPAEAPLNADPARPIVVTARSTR